MAILVPKKIRHMYPVGDCFWLMRVMKSLWVFIIRKFRTEQHRDSILNVREQALDGAVKWELGFLRPALRLESFLAKVKTVSKDLQSDLGGLPRGRPLVAGCVPVKMRNVAKRQRHQKGF